jgi:hypothetical protein
LNKYGTSLNTAKNAEYPSKDRAGNFCPATGSAGVVPAPYQLPICFISVFISRGSVAEKSLGNTGIKSEQQAITDFATYDFFFNFLTPNQARQPS